MPPKSQSSGSKILTAAQQRTLELLMSGNTDIKQADTTRLLNSLSKMDKLTPDIIDKVVKLERKKYPTLTDLDIKSKLVKRFKGSMKDLLKDEIKITEETKEEKQLRRFEKKKGTMDEFKKKTNINETPIANPFIPNPSQPIAPTLNYQNPFIPNPNKPALVFNQGIPSQPAIYSSFQPSAPPDPFPDASAPSEADIYGNPNRPSAPRYEDALNMQNPRPSFYERAGNAASNLYNEGVNLYGQASNLYFENKPMIDSLEKTFSKQNIDNGSWFTGLASLEAPQIAIIQQILKYTPIGASQIDYEVINAIASGNGDNVPESQLIKTMLKTIVNPDLMGKVIGSTIKQSYDQSVEAIEKTFDKAMGTKAVVDKTSLEQQSADAIKKRLEEMKTQENRKKYIDSIMGTTTPTTTTPTPNKNAAEILAPPDISNFGYHETTVMEDLGRFFRNAIGLGQFSGPSNKEEYIQYLKVNNPTLYNKYQQTVKDYNWNLKKSTLTQDSDLDVSIEQNKKVIQSIISTNDVLTKRAKDLGLSDPKLVGEAFYINEKLKKVMAGTGGVMSYTEVKKLQEQIINLYPQSVLNAASKDLNQLYGDVDNLLSSKFTGDSNISTRPDIPKNDDRFIDPNRIDPNTKKPIGETQITSKDYSGSSFPRLRPRLVWGGEEEILKRDADEVNNANIYADMMSMELPGWSNGISNPLFLINQQTENRRYAQTFPMPKFKPKRISRPTQAYSQLSKIIFTPQYSQPEYSPFDTARDPYDFGQFQNFAPSVFNTVFPVKLQQNYPQYFPYVINEETGGEGLQVNTNASANIPNNKLSSYLTNQRFTRR